MPVGQLSDSSLFGGQRIPFVNLSCALLCSCTFLLTFCTYVYQVEIICVLLGAANGAYLTMETSLAVDALETLKRDFHGDQNDLLLEDDNATDGNAIGGKNDGCSDKEVAGEDEADEDSIGAAQLLGIWGVAGFVGKNLVLKILSFRAYFLFINKDDSFFLTHYLFLHQG